MSEKPVHIYALYDPLDGTVRYIGRTTDPKARLSQHARATEWAPPSTYTLKKKLEWLRSLKEKGIKPHMVILETVSAQEATELERVWIGRGLRWGWPLLNTQCYWSKTDSEDFLWPYFEVARSKGWI